jgi:hypothetical protein
VPATSTSRKLRSAYGVHRVASRQAADLLGVSEVSARTWANAGFAPDGHHLAALAALFGVEAQVFTDRFTEAEAIQALASAFDTAPIRREVANASR